ncbi:MAG: aspartate aminotransferase family protein [Halofilum sp. (in: g-proteobacteria)]
MARTGSSGDYAAFWMPFTDNQQFKREPRMLVEAEGMTYRAEDGHEILDGTAGLWCVIAGHGRREIIDAVSRQLEKFDFGPTFQMGHPLPFELAERLTQHLPAGLDRVFFTNSGSESVDSALKIARAYQHARGQAGRWRLIGRERAYHGVNFGGTSVGGIGNNRKVYGPLLAGTDHVRHTHDLKRNAFSHGLPEHGAELAEDLERLIALHGAETIAAFIVEPIAGSTGVLLPPKGYLERVREICNRHDILLIFDEVITGFGRVGASVAAERFGVTPDMITMAKGLTNGVVPMGAVAVRREIHDAFMHGSASGAAIDLFHGYTYSGHPTACAAGLAALDIFERDGLLTRARELEDYWAQRAHELDTAPHVIDVRNFGLIAAVELAAKPGAPGQRGFETLRRCFEDGLLVRVTGDIIALSPPLIVSEEQIDRIFSMLGDALQACAAAER